MSGTHPQQNLHLKLDCHLNWKLSEGATKIHIKEVIREVEKRLKEVENPNPNAEWFDLPNHLLLCYMHNNPDTSDLDAAKNDLEKAKKKNSGEFYDKEACDWIIQAIELCISETADQTEAKSLLEKQNNFTDVQKATIKALHAFSLVRFGPNKYKEAAKLFDEVQTLTNSNNFLFLYDHAVLLGKSRRFAAFESQAEEKEKELWNKAWGLYERNNAKMDTACEIEFARRYAESAVGFDLERAVVISQKHSNIKKSNLKIHYKALIKFHKVFRVCRSESDGQLFTEDVKKSMAKLTQKLYDLESSGIEDSQLYHTLALEREYEARQLENQDEKLKKLEMCVPLLEKAQEFATSPGHIYVDLMLIAVKFELKPADNFQDTYLSLSRKYRRSLNNVATTYLNWGWYLISTAKVHEGMRKIGEAVDLDENAPERLLDGKKEAMIEKVKNLTGYAIWLKHVFHNQGNFDKEADAFINSQESSEQEERQFVIIRLVLYRIQNKNLQTEHLIDKITNESDQHFAACQRVVSIGSFDDIKGLSQKLENLTQLSPQHGHKICQEMLPKLEEESKKPEWKPQRREVYELCAQIYLTVLDIGSEEAQVKVKARLYAILRIPIDEVDNMRRHRFKATQLELKRQRNKFKDTDLQDNLLHTLRTARASLDKSVKLLYPSACFPFAFLSREWHARARITDWMGAVITDKSVFNTSFQKSWEMKVSKATPGQPTSSISQKQINSIYSKLHDQEYKIITTEGGWLSRWNAVRNDNEHNITPADRDLIKVLGENLLKDSKYYISRNGPKSVYELAHRAADFAEETRNIFSTALRQ